MRFHILAGVLVVGSVLTATPPSQADPVPGSPPTGVRQHESTQAAVGTSLAPFYQDVGHIELSLDAVGTNNPSGTVQVSKPTSGTVRKAFLFAASTGFTSYQPVDGDVEIDGSPVAWDPAMVIPNSIYSYNAVADVTDLVKDKLDASAEGVVDFTVTEDSSYDMDGEILAVVWSVPQGKTRSIALFYGAQNTEGDSFSVNLGRPLKASSTATMSLGISFGYQIPWQGGQRSEIDIDGERLTSSAGGQDDGEGMNGALITVGGVGDEPANPADPNLTECGSEPRCDDELYDLKSVLDANATSFTINTRNPSNDDNIMLAAFDISAVEAAFGESVTVTPGDARQEVGTTHVIQARAQDADGNPSNATVTFEIIDGPNKGRPLFALPLRDGRWETWWTSSSVGTDKVQASFEGTSGKVVSNIARQVWAPDIKGTFGGLWPYGGNQLSLTYAYQGKFAAEVDVAAERWNASPTKVDVQKWAGAPLALHLPMADVEVNDTWWGGTVFAEGCGTCGYTANAIYFNTRTLSSETAAQQQKVATHEIGHALGLMHPPDYAVPSNVPSLMRQGRLSTTVQGFPQTLDTDRVNGMYP